MQKTKQCEIVARVRLIRASGYMFFIVKHVSSDHVFVAQIGTAPQSWPKFASYPDALLWCIQAGEVANMDQHGGNVLIQTANRAMFARFDVAFQAPGSHANMLLAVSASGHMPDLLGMNAAYTRGPAQHSDIPVLDESQEFDWFSWEISEADGLRAASEKISQQLDA